MSTEGLCALKQIHNLQEIIDDSINEDSIMITSYELREQEIIKSLLESLNECKGKLQVTNTPHFYMGRISALKECLRLYGVKL